MSEQKEETMIYMWKTWGDRVMEDKDTWVPATE